MKLSKEAMQYLVEPKYTPSVICSDTANVKFSEICKNWKEIDGAEVGILGVPYDGGVTMRQGCRFGPDVIREKLMVFPEAYSVARDLDISDLKVVDYGNVIVNHQNPRETFRRTELVLTEIIKSGVVPVVIGGDHSLGYPHIKSLMNNVAGKIGVIQMDAHLDVREPDWEFLNTGTPFRRLIEEPDRNPLDPKNLIELGTNSWVVPKAGADYCREKGIAVVTANEIHRRGVEDVLKQAFEVVTNGTDAFWLSFDIDCLDVCLAPGTCAPNPGGLTSQEALDFIWEIANHPKCAGIDLVEVSPTEDCGEITSFMAYTLCMEFIGGVRNRKNKK